MGLYKWGWRPHEAEKERNAPPTRGVRLLGDHERVGALSWWARLSWISQRFPYLRVRQFKFPEAYWCSREHAGVLYPTNVPYGEAPSKEVRAV